MMLASPQVRDQHTDHGEESSQRRVRQAGAKLVEVVAYRGQQPHTGVETGDQEDGGQQDLSAVAEQSLCQDGKGLGAGAALRVRISGQCADMPQHPIDSQQQPGCDEPGPSCTALHLFFLGDAQGADIQRQHGTKIQARQSVHGLVAVQHALGGRKSLIIPRSGA